VIAKNINPVLLLNLLKKGIVGIVLKEGSRTSHAAILARNFGIPAVAGVSEIWNEAGNNEMLVVNGNSGEVFLNPEESIIQKYKKIKHNYKIIFENFRKNINVPVQTIDGVRIEVLANIEVPEEVELVINNYAADGIGLFRTEYLFLNRDDLPDEEQQYVNYSGILKKCGKKEVTIRTTDIGGDKFFTLKNRPDIEEDIKNLRAIRFSLKHINCLWNVNSSFFFF
jgi:phosphotransferase system enzyme I (PtsI)